MSPSGPRARLRAKSRASGDLDLPRPRTEIDFASKGDIRHGRYSFILRSSWPHVSNIFCSILAFRPLALPIRRPRQRLAMLTRAIENDVIVATLLDVAPVAEIIPPPNGGAKNEIHASAVGCCPNRGRRHGDGCPRRSQCRCACGPRSWDLPPGSDTHHGEWAEGARQCDRLDKRTRDQETECWSAGGGNRRAGGRGCYVLRQPRLLEGGGARQSEVLPDRDLVSVAELELRRDRLQKRWNQHAGSARRQL